MQTFVPNLFDHVFNTHNSNTLEGEIFTMVVDAIHKKWIVSHEKKNLINSRKKFGLVKPIIQFTWVHLGKSLFDA